MKRCCFDRQFDFHRCSALEASFPGHRLMKLLRKKIAGNSRNFFQRSGFFE